MNQEYMGGEDFMGQGVGGAAAHGSSNENSIDISNHSVTMTIMEPSDSVVLRGHNCTIEIGAGNTISSLTISGTERAQRRPRVSAPPAARAQPGPAVGAGVAQLVFHIHPVGLPRRQRIDPGDHAVALIGMDPLEPVGGIDLRLAGLEAHRADEAVLTQLAIGCRTLLPATRELRTAGEESGEESAMESAPSPSSRAASARPAWCAGRRAHGRRASARARRRDRRSACGGGHRAGARRPRRHPRCRPIRRLRQQWQQPTIRSCLAGRA